MDKTIYNVLYKEIMSIIELFEYQGFIYVKNNITNNLFSYFTTYKFCLYRPNSFYLVKNIEPSLYTKMTFKDLINNIQSFFPISLLISLEDIMFLQIYKPVYIDENFHLLSKKSIAKKIKNREIFFVINYYLITKNVKLIDQITNIELNNFNNITIQ